MCPLDSFKYCPEYKLCILVFIAGHFLIKVTWISASRFSGCKPAFGIIPVTRVPGFIKITGNPFSFVKWRSVKEGKEIPF